MCLLLQRSYLGLKCVSTSSQQVFVAKFCSTPCLYGRKSRKPYDKRHSMTLLGSDVGPKVPGGTVAMMKEVGLRADMPQPPGYFDKHGKLHIVPEMIPEFVVPDLKDFKLKPYVSYKVPEITQSALDPEDIFSACYAQDIAHAYSTGKTDDKDIEEILNKKSKLS